MSPSPLSRLSDHQISGSLVSRRNRYLLIALVVSLLLHATVFWYLRSISLGLLIGGEEQDIALQLAPDAPAPADSIAQPEPLRRPKPSVSLVRPLPSRTRISDPIAASATQITKAPPATSLRLSTSFGRGRPGAFGSFDELLEQMRRYGLDVVLTIDTTGSMGWVIEEVRDRIGEMVDVVRGFVPKTRFGIVAYRDYDDASYLTKVLPLTYRKNRLREFLRSLDAEGGGDIFEALDPAIAAAIDKSGFRSNSVQVILVVGDAPPHPETMGRLLNRVHAFRSRGGVLTFLDVSLRSNPEILRKLHGMTNIEAASLIPEFSELASVGGGEVVNLMGTTQVARNLVVAIFGTQWMDWLIPFLGGLE